MPKPTKNIHTARLRDTADRKQQIRENLALQAEANETGRVPEALDRDLNRAERRALAKVKRKQTTK